MTAGAQVAGEVYVEAEGWRAAAASTLPVRHGIKVFALVPQRETLEEVFLRLTRGGGA